MSDRSALGDAPLTMFEAAALFGIPRATLRAHALRGRLRAVKVGNQWLIPADELARYVAEERGRPGGGRGTDAGATKEG